MTIRDWYNHGGIRRGLAAFGMFAIFGLSGFDLRAQSTAQGLWSGHPAVAGPAPNGQVRPHAWIRDAFIGPAAEKPASRSGPGGFWPIDMQTAYGINSISGLLSLGNGLSGGGQGITVAVVDAYSATNARADLNFFSTQFGLPTMPAASGAVCTPKFTKVGQTGGTPPTAKNSGWEVETSLDIQWVHAVAPCANILLVEANSAGSLDLLAAVNYAGTHAQVVSMSWGGGEFGGESSYDNNFQTSNVVFFASSGDTGGIVEWPSVSSSVVAVGGTNLPVNSSNGGLGTGAETAWNGSGGGCSNQNETEPTVESAIKYPSTCKHRGVPDVAASGGPNSAVSVYISDLGGWLEVYGTSLASPMWAATVGIADGLRKKGKKAYLSNLTLADLYAAYSYSYAGNYNDIKSGTAGSNTAGTGWDFVTGLGSPKANDLVTYLSKTAP